ncbi:MAG: hypothetical protein HKL99_15275 [Burkholderiales bacterium]|jgi:hypothetical protein|nr:hypothetical protein [Burkholderiales bacterium]
MSRPILLNPVAYAIEGACKLPPEQRAAIVAGNTAALTALREGHATRDQFDRLTQALLIADELRAHGLARDHADTFATAIDALAAILARMERTGGRYVARGPELTAIDDAVFVHSVQIENVALSEMERAQRRLGAQWRQQRRATA